METENNQKYNESLEKAKEIFFNKKYKPSEAALIKEILGEIFPELDTNKDEKIRQAIVLFFELQDDNTTYSLIPKNDILEYLERIKDYEQKVSLTKETSDTLDSLISFIEKMINGQTFLSNTNELIPYHKLLISLRNYFSEEE